MSTEARLVSLSREGDISAGELDVSALPPWTVSIQSEGSSYSAEGRDLFEAFLAVREQLERRGALVCCAGALPNVWPSGMSVQMSGGRLAYRLYSDRRSNARDLIDIFSPAGCEDVVTVEVQRRT